MRAALCAISFLGRHSYAFQPRHTLGGSFSVGRHNGRDELAAVTSGALRHRPHTLAPLAGVAGGTAWLRKKFPEAFWESSEPPAGGFDHAYVDSNDFLHSMTKRAKGSSHLFKEMGRKLDTYSRKVKPRRTLFIAADGPGPAAKMLLQRKRRAKTSGAGKAAKENDNSRSSGSAGINGAALTPGTRLMVALDRALHNYAINRLEKQLPYDRSLAITVNGPQCVGEGETKMLAHFYSLARDKDSSSNNNDNGSPRNGRKPQPVQKHGLIGTDSDLLLMALASGVVASPGSGVVRGVDPRQHDLTVLQLKPPMDTYFSGSKFAAALHNQLQEESNGKDEVTSRPRVEEVALDLVALFLLGSGNDYLSPVKGCSIDSLWSAYLDLRCSSAGGSPPLIAVEDESTLKTHVNRAVLKELLDKSATVAPFWEYAKKSPYVAATAPATAVVEKLITTTTASASSLEKAREYLAAVEWNLDMYVQGSCPDYTLGFVPQTMKESIQEVCRLDLKDSKKDQGQDEEWSRTHSGWKMPPLKMPPPPGIYNLLVQHSSELVAPPLRHLMTDAESPVHWLYAHGCRCKECGELYAEMKPLAQAVSRLGALGKPNLREGTENGDAMALAQAGMAAVSKRQLQHEAKEHGGAHVHFNQLPTAEEVQAICLAYPPEFFASQAQDQEDCELLALDAASMAFEEPRTYRSPPSPSFPSSQQQRQQQQRRPSDFRPLDGGGRGRSGGGRGGGGSGGSGGGRNSFDRSSRNPRPPVTTRPPIADTSSASGAPRTRSSSAPKAVASEGGAILPHAANTKKVAREVSKASPPQQTATTTSKKAVATTATKMGTANKKSVTELREALAARGLATKGLKAELIARLDQAHNDA